jgi:hypothetical protein
MKRGDYFAIGEGRKVSLLCECRGIGNGVIYGYVVNGAWEFTLEAGILTVIAKNTMHEVNIIWEGEIPRGLGDYNDAIEYIERRLNHWAITNTLIDQWIRLGETWIRFKRAIGAAKRAYLKVYEANSQFVNDEEDLIPF